MSRKLVLATLFIAVLIGTLGLSFAVQRVEASGTVYIRADGSIDPSDAPVSTLDNVTYTLTDNITSSAGGGLIVERDNIAVDGAGYILSVFFPPTRNGIALYDRSNVTIKNMKIQGLWDDGGIGLVRCSNSTISGNIIAADFPLQSWSLRLDYSSNNKVVDNTFTHNGLYAVFSYQNTVENNTVNGKPLVYLEGVSNCTVNDAGQVILVRCNNVTVKDLDLLNTTAGVELFETNNTTISENNITENNLGILLDMSSNNIVTGNIITKNRVGIWLESRREQESINNTISGSRIAENSYGIWVRSSNYNSIIGNYLTNNGEGIHLELSSYNSVYENNITENYEYGIGVVGSPYGPYYLNNTFCHNNFVSNTNQVRFYSSMNGWDDGVEGNYWSNYTGVDLDHDGIGDTAYIMDANNTDRYPLMGMFSEFNWVGIAAPEQRIQTICNSTISNLIYNGTAISFDVTGDNGTSGFCRIQIPKVLMNSTFTVLVNGTEIAHTLLPSSNENCTYLFFNYTHSTKEIIILPEFPSFFILPLFFIALLLAVLVYRKKHSGLFKK